MGDRNGPEHANRKGVFRLSFPLNKSTYEDSFGKHPERPLKGEVIKSHFDFTELNLLMHHPVYGWMSWVQILNPSHTNFELLMPKLEVAYSCAQKKFETRSMRR